MKKNLGKIDRFLRILVGTAIIVIALYYQSWWALLGAGLLLNGLSGRCGAYALFGFSTAGDNCELTNKQNTSEKAE